MTFWSILGALLVLAVCILIHEAGHFVSALMLGIPVEEFSVGFGPKIVQLKRKGIKYSLRWIPLGGYVRYYMDDSDFDRALKQPDDAYDDEQSGTTTSLKKAMGDRSYMSQPAWKRLISVVCGPLMNFVLALMVAVLLYVNLGNPVAVPRIYQYATDSAAYAAGLDVGDVIVSVNGEAVTYDEAGILTLQSAIAGCDGGPITLEVERGSERITAEMTPVYNQSENRYMIGVTFGTAYTPCSFWEAISRAGRYMYTMTIEMYKSLGGLFTSEIPIDQQLTGPVGTVQIISENVQRGGLDAMNVIMMISLNFGILNLLPIPGLDGSKVVFLLIEMIRRKPIPPAREAIVSLIGLALLFGLTLFVTYKDVLRLITGG